MASGYIRDFTKGSIFKGMAGFALPLFCSNLLQAVYNMVDMIVVGQYVGKNGLSAVSIGGDVLTMLTFIAMGFSNAGQIIIAQHVGAGRRADVGKIMGTLFTFLFFSAVILGVVCLIFRETLLGWMNTPAEVWDDTLRYATVCMVGLLFIYGYNAVSAVLRGMGDSRHPFLFVATAAILNLILDIVFVVRLGMGAFGAALATVIGQGVSFVWGMLFLFLRRDRLGFPMDRKALRPSREMFRALLKLGVPMAIKSASITFSKLFVDASVNVYGVVVSGVSGIESKMNLIINLFSNAINASASTFIGQNIGAEAYDRVPKILRIALTITLTVAVILSGVVLLFPEAIFGIFSTDREVLDACLTMLPLMFLLFFGSALRAPSNGLIDGSGNYRLNFVTAVLDGVVGRIGFAVLFGRVMGMGWLGYLYGDAAAGFVPVIICIVYFISGRWKTRKYIIHQ